MIFKLVFSLVCVCLRLSSSNAAKTDMSLDIETGEVVEEERNPHWYIKVYQSGWDFMVSNTAFNNRVLSSIFSLVAYDTNVVYMYKHQKQVCCDKLGIQLASFNNELVKLVKAGVLVRIHRACYIVNPGMFHHGSEAKRQKLYWKMYKQKV